MNFRKIMNKEIYFYIFDFREDSFMYRSFDNEIIKLSKEQIKSLYKAFEKFKNKQDNLIVVPLIKKKPNFVKALSFSDYNMEKK